jgi:hypothetical protein
MDDWRKEEALKALEKRKRIEELYGINFQQISEKISLMNESLTVSMNESLKAMRSVARLPKSSFLFQNSIYQKYLTKQTFQ